MFSWLDFLKLVEYGCCGTVDYESELCDGYTEQEARKILNKESDEKFSWSEILVLIEELFLLNSWRIDTSGFWNVADNDDFIDESYAHWIVEQPRWRLFEEDFKLYLKK